MGGKLAWGVKQNIAGRCQQTFLDVKKNSNVRDYFKVMGLNPGYLLKFSLLKKARTLYLYRGKALLHSQNIKISFISI